MRTGLFTGNFANDYANSIIATYFIEIKKKCVALEIAKRPSGKFHGKKTIPNFRPNSIGGFAVGETKKTTEP